VFQLVYIFSELERIGYEANDKLKVKFQEIQTEFENRIQNSIGEITAYRDQSLPNLITKESVSASIEKAKSIYEFQREQLKKTVLPLVEHVSRLDFDLDEELLQGAYKEEYEQIKYQWEQTRETAQLGIAVEIIDHEFNVLYSQINAAIKKLIRTLLTPLRKPIVT